MTTDLVVTITDELVAELEALAEFATPGEWSYAEHDDCDYVEGPCSEFIGTADNVHDGYYMAKANPATILALLSERAELKRRVDTYERALLLIAEEVDGNVRPTVRDIINGMPDANDIYDYCVEIDRIIDQAMQERQK